MADGTLCKLSLGLNVAAEYKKWEHNSNMGRCVIFPGRDSAVDGLNFRPLFYRNQGSRRREYGVGWGGGLHSISPSYYRTGRVRGIFTLMQNRIFFVNYCNKFSCLKIQDGWTTYTVCKKPAEQKSAATYFRNM